MNRPWQIVGAFGACLAVVLAAMGWISHEVLRLDQAEAEARRTALREENIRLAMWRMESALGPVVAQESAQPYFAYTAFYPAERAYTRMFNRVAQGDILLPSPILAPGVPHVLLNFQIGPKGNVTSPQVPTGIMREMAESGYTTRETIEAASLRLERLRGLVTADALAAVLPKQDGPDAVPPVPALAGGNFNFDNTAMAQSERNEKEYQARAQATQTANTAVQTQRGQNRLDLGGVREGVMRPIWLGETLVLARRVNVNGQEYFQGAWLDWPAIRQWLLGGVRDLVPEADLVVVRDGAAGEGARLLAALPVRLEPGRIPAGREEPLSPVALSLVVAWVCVLLAAAAVAVLLVGTVSLSERRGDFVSAVTHELRTPLTTFRLYSEMLAEGMVTDEAKRRRYLNTLRVEAERLSHLVENVLAYARLERGRARGRPEPVRMADLVGGVQERLADRARQAGMELVVEVPDGAGETVVRADASAVEQILFNLVDNACKYAAGAEDKRLHLVADPGGGRGQEPSAVKAPDPLCRGGGRACLKVCDHGPGIAASEARRLFRPFSKSARQAANSAPGVGLGLALSRRMARDMGGDLELAPVAGGGACFVLRMARP